MHVDIKEGCIWTEGGVCHYINSLACIKCGLSLVARFVTTRIKTKGVENCSTLGRGTRHSSLTSKAKISFSLFQKGIHQYAHLAFFNLISYSKNVFFLK